MTGLTIIVKKITNVMVPSIILFGIYIVCHGHLTPGGGFAGGVIISGAFVLMVLAYGSTEARTELMRKNYTFAESFGLFIFWFLAIFGLLTNNTFFLNVITKADPGTPYRLFSAGIIPLCNVAIGIEVSASLFAIFLTLAVLKMGDNL
jgi:multisubunit Na+/H+ antiporter MnhB subunit